MSAPDWKALGERALKCSRWRWMPGAADENGVRVGNLPHPPDLRYPAQPFGMVVPDLSDPATLGCLLALVREAYGDPAAHVEPVGAVASGRAQWAVRIFSGECPYPFIQCQRVTEVEALVAALEAAPQQEAPDAEG